MRIESIELKTRTRKRVEVRRRNVALRRGRILAMVAHLRPTEIVRQDVDDVRLRNHRRGGKVLVAARSAARCSGFRSSTVRTCLTTSCVPRFQLGLLFFFGVSSITALRAHRETVDAIASVNHDVKALHDTIAALQVAFVDASMFKKAAGSSTKQS